MSALIYTLTSPLSLANDALLRGEGILFYFLSFLFNNTLKKNDKKCDEILLLKLFIYFFVETVNHK